MTIKNKKIEQARKVHGEKYDYSEWPDNVINLDKLPITCKKHNIRFIQLIKTHLRGSSGCHKCTKISMPKTRDERIQQVNDVHKGKYDYSEFPTERIINKSKVKIRCIKHNVIFEQIFEHHLSGKVGCKQCIDDKKTATNMKRFGCKYSLLNKTVKDKAKKTYLKNYGYENPFQNENIKKKIKETNLKKYGYENPSMSDKIKEKKRQISLKTYGVENHLQHKHIKDKIKETNLKKYGYEFATQKHISKQTMENLNNKDWLYDQHIIQEKSLLQISKELNDVGDSMVGKYLHNHGIITKHHCRSTGEKEVGDFVANLGVTTNFNVRDVITPYELDIYIPEHKLAIEYCGLYWHSEQAGKGRQYHRDKMEMCRDMGIRLLTIFEDEWANREEIVKSTIKAILGKDDRQKVYARKTTIEVISKSNKSEFFEQTHIQGDGPSSINIGLMYGGELVACMGFIKQGIVYYLNRYATSHRVVGGFSKLLKYFKSEYECETIISFADLRWSNGGVYNKTGWKLDKLLDPDYSYSYNNECKRHHKFNFRRKNLSKLLDEFDPNVSERINCNNNGILRLWDCGKQRWIMENS